MHETSSIPLRAAFSNSDILLKFVTLKRFDSIRFDSFGRCSFNRKNKNDLERCLYKSFAETIRKPRILPYIYTYNGNLINSV